MKSMNFADIFDAEVVNYQSKDNRTPCMELESRGGRTLIVVVFLETSFEENVGQDARLR